MRKRYAAIAAGVAAILLMAAPGASAVAREEGVTCEANASAPGWTLIGFDPRRIFPVELGELPTRVITRWKIQVAPGKGPLAQQLIAFRQVGEEEDRETGESAVETVSEGLNEFATRVPVEGLHPHVGLRGPVETLYCAEQKEMLSGVVQGAFAIGETRRYGVKVGIGTPITVTVEPDRDDDGYGDLTQDKCPQSAEFQERCPQVTLAFWARAKERMIRTWVMATSWASVHVFGQVGWRLAPQGNRSSGDPGRKRLIVGLDGGTKEVAGEDAQFNFPIPLPKAVLRKLARMTPDESLKAKIAARYTDAAGRVGVKRIVVKLPGQERSG